MWWSIHALPVTSTNVPGPGFELHRVTVECDQASFEYPSVGSVQIPPGECLDGPIYVGLKMSPGNALPTPLPVLDNQQVQVACERWFYSAATGEWQTWRRKFADSLPGYPMIEVTLTESDSACTFYQCHNPADIDEDGFVSIGDYVYWINWQFGGGPGPFGRAADLNCDCIVNSEDEPLYLPILSPLFVCSFPPCAPVELICNCPNPYTETKVVRPGDADNSGNWSISDAVYIVNYIFGGDPAPVESLDWPNQCGGFF